MLAHPFLWPLLAAATASEVTASYLGSLVHEVVGPEGPSRRGVELSWSTLNRVVVELQSMRLRQFGSAAEGTPTLVCAPLALHAATVADLAPRHSLVGILRREGLQRLFVTDWRSATPDMRFLGIDNYLGDLNVAVDTIGPPVDLVGLCQGGWLALVYAARFPGKVRKLVLAGAPVDLQAGESGLSHLAASVPLPMFEEIVRRGVGLVRGEHMRELWGYSGSVEAASRALQIAADPGDRKRRVLDRRFAEWFAWTVDLPGTYYLQVVTWLYKENRIARDRFVALGQPIRLADLTAPIFLLAARDDELVAPAQLLATARLVGTPGREIHTLTEPSGHLALFMGGKTLRRTWPQIVRWLTS
jgi:poly(3-hydroxyalkanoate) synthetase